MFQLVLYRLLESYFLHRWLYLLPILLMTVVAAIYPSTITSTYNAAGNIYIQNETLLSSLNAVQNEGFGWVTPAQATAAEMNQLFNANAFLRAIVQQTDLAIEMTGDPQVDGALTDQVRGSIWVNPLGNNLLTIGASHENPRVTYQLATSIINTYLQWKINLKLEGSKAAQSFFVEKIDDYKSELDPIRQELIDYLTTHPEPLRGERPVEESVEIARLQAIVDQGLERVGSAEGKEENARLAMVQAENAVRQTYFTVDEPIMPIKSDRSLKQIALTMMVCVAAGFMLTVVAIVGGALIDRTFRFPVDVRHGLSLSVLAMVPESKDDAWVVTQSSPADAGATLVERRSVGNEQPVPIKPRKPQRIFGYK